MTEGTLRVNDRLSVFLRTWQPAGRPRGVTALVHGLGEHSGQYAEVAEFLTGRDFLVLALDLPGHGKNPGVRGHGSYALYEAVIGAVVVEARRQAGPGTPVFMYGHSMGANCIVSWQLAHPGEHLGGIVAASPSFGAPAPKPSAAKRALGRTLAVIWPSFTMGNGLDLGNLSRDRARAEAVRNDPGFHTKVSALLGVSFMDAWVWFASWPGGPLASPALILQGTADRIVDPEATISVARKLSGDVTLKTWEGFYHILHEEPERGEVLGFIAGWMEKRLA